MSLEFSDVLLFKFVCHFITHLVLHSIPNSRIEKGCSYAQMLHQIRLERPHMGYSGVSYNIYIHICILHNVFIYIHIHTYIQYIQYTLYNTYLIHLLPVLVVNVLLHKVRALELLPYENTSCIEKRKIHKTT